MDRGHHKTQNFISTINTEKLSSALAQMLGVFLVIGPELGRSWAGVCEK